MSNKNLRVGILGAGEVAQVIHLPVLSMLSHLYTTVAICDISQKASCLREKCDPKILLRNTYTNNFLQNADHCAAKFHIALATTHPQDLFAHPDIDVIFNLTSDDCHEPYTIAALQAGKHVLLEKPVTLSLPSAQRILDTERAAPNGARVFVGYMRRYATSFTKTFMREVGGVGRVLYARVRDFSGPNAWFVDGSGTFQVKNTDFPSGAGEERAKRFDALFKEAFPGQPITPERVNYCRFLGSLGSHDLSLMREVLGAPDSVAGVSVNDPFYSAIFNYTNRTPGREKFSVTYESGIDAVPDFDAHLAIYGERKRVMIKYDSPYVKGLPIKVTVQEVNGEGEMETREMLGGYEDAYTSELREMWGCFVEGREAKTSVEDAMGELRLYDAMYERWHKQQKGEA